MNKKENFSGKIKRFNTAINGNISETISFLGKIKIFLDFLYEWKYHDVYLQDYIQYEFYWKKKSERKKYVVHGKLLEIMKTCNNPEKRYIFDQKPEFDRTFSEFLQRDWLDTSRASLKDFKKFIQGKEDFFAKDPNGMFGLGINKINTKNITNVDEIFKKFKEKKILCENTLRQCEEMAAFNNTSINTLRVVSLVKADGEVVIMGGLLRVGRKGRIADNFHHKGIAAFIDPQSGIVCTTGIDKDNKRYVLHPDSNVQIVGFKVPIWNQVTDTVKRAAKVIPEMRYIGWDVVITDNYKVELVEGNPGADPDAEQITTKEGRWPYYQKYLTEIKMLPNR